MVEIDSHTRKIQKQSKYSVRFVQRIANIWFIIINYAEPIDFVKLSVANKYVAIVDSTNVFIVACKQRPSLLCGEVKSECLNESTTIDERRKFIDLNLDTFVHCIFACFFCITHAKGTEQSQLVPHITSY